MINLEMQDRRMLRPSINHRHEVATIISTMVITTRRKSLKAEGYSKMPLPHSRGLTSESSAPPSTIAKQQVKLLIPSYLSLRNLTDPQSSRSVGGGGGGNDPSYVKWTLLSCQYVPRRLMQRRGSPRAHFTITFKMQLSVVPYDTY